MNKIKNKGLIAVLICFIAVLVILITLTLIHIINKPKDIETFESKLVNEVSNEVR